MKNKLRQKQALTKNQSLVLKALRKAKQPVGAYEILDQLREHGLKAPLQIYRTLDQKCVPRTKNSSGSRFMKCKV